MAYMGKIKFLNWFYLFSGISRLKCEGQEKTCNEEGFEDEIVDNFECNPEWPICLYDFTYKNRCGDALAYQVQEMPELMEDYFERIDEPKPLYSPTTEYSKLRIERNRHICGDKEFVSNFKKLFKTENLDFFESEYLSFNIWEFKDAKRSIKEFKEVCRTLVEELGLDD